VEFECTPIVDLYTVRTTVRKDFRGTFTRLFSSKEFAEVGLTSQFVQSNFSQSVIKGTFRGLHMQINEHQETKVVVAVQGAVRDFVLDLRPESPSYLEIFHLDLIAEEGSGVVVPKGCAHGYFTLTDAASLVYFVDTPYSSAHEICISPLDSELNLQLPYPICQISDKDRNGLRLSDYQNLK